MGLDNASPMELGINIVMFVVFGSAFLFLLYHFCIYIYKHGITFFDLDAYKSYQISQKGGGITKIVTGLIFLSLPIIAVVLVVLYGHGRPLHTPAR